MNGVVELLEQKRMELGLNAREFCRTMLPNPDPGIYSRVVHGRSQIPRKWHSSICKLLNLDVGELTALLENKRVPFPEKKWDAEELSQCADVVRRVGKPLTLKTIERILKDIEMSGS